MGQAQRATTNVTEATERTQSKHRAGIVSEASGQCEMFAKCERTTELPQNSERKRLADANDGRKDGQNIATMLKYKYESFLEE